MWPPEGRETWEGISSGAGIWDVMEEVQVRLAFREGVLRSREVSEATEVPKSQALSPPLAAPPSNVSCQAEPRCPRSDS